MQPKQQSRQIPNSVQHKEKEKTFNDSNFVDFVIVKSLYLISIGTKIVFNNSIVKITNCG